MEKNKNKKDSDHSNVEVQSSKVGEKGRREGIQTQPRHHNIENQQQELQDDWQIQRRRNSNNHQVRFNTNNNVMQHQPTQSGIISIPTKNTYIDLDLQETTYDGGGVEEHIAHIHAQKDQYQDHLNRQIQSQDGIQEYRDQRSKQQRLELPVTRNIQTVQNRDGIIASGINLMLPSPAPPYNADNIVGVAVGGG